MKTSAFASETESIFLFRNYDSYKARSDDAGVTDRVLLSEKNKQEC